MVAQITISNKGGSHTCFSKITKHTKGFKRMGGNESNTVTKEGDEDAFEDNADKIPK